VRLDFGWADDGEIHQYCFQCHEEAVERVRCAGRTFYDCGECGVRSDRSIVVDPSVRWWIGLDQEYWHESAGVFVRDPLDRFLFFERTAYPFVLTVPAGHVDVGEDAFTAARRELAEETAIEAATLTLLGVDDLVGDSCRRGADAHRWHAYLTDRRVAAGVVELDDEGRKPVWLTPDQACRRPLATPVGFVLEKYRHLLLRNR
jgi:8-oxo-dGTP pyrophosphatase MutT (NUDIX family)